MTSDFLTAREARVLDLIKRGIPFGGIANMMEIGEDEIAHCMKQIIWKKLRATSISGQFNMCPNCKQLPLPL